MTPDQMPIVFKFLKRNHSQNEGYQREEYRRCLTHCATANDRLWEHLHAILNSQSQPKIGPISNFWKVLNEAKWGDEGPTLEEFCSHFDSYTFGRIRKAEGPWQQLFFVLQKQSGWGSKTAALFVKSTIDIHRGDARLHFLRDPEEAKSIQKLDRLYLPVDAVIQHVFATSGRKSFDSINNLLKEEGYAQEDMLMWDDLWFWGFFNQKIVNKRRIWEWNPDKFWTQRGARYRNMKRIERLSTEFRQLVQ